MMTFNLIITTFKHSEDDALSEILDLLMKFGDTEAEIIKTQISGIILGYTRLDPTSVILKLKSLINTEPWEVRYILRVIPVEHVTSTDLRLISLVVKTLALKIPDNETFRITIEKRHSAIRSNEIITAIAKEISSNSVDLDKPDWIVLVEIVGQLTGVSVIRPSQLFSSVIEKRDTAIL
ncbi:MAG TPA: THUMP domain-containing protein [Nitrososphaeraceae archaeon]|jgi:tRNA acetyltransferase TAN1|nr:THUMP domain-containing protein [Nitrososphaeraceae archaeon]